MNDAEKLEAIEELMHPGYWSALDGRRERILNILGSDRREWRRDMYAEGLGLDKFTEQKVDWRA